jgi:hypothetical protein
VNQAAVDIAEMIDDMHIRYIATAYALKFIGDPALLAREIEEANAQGRGGPNWGLLMGRNDGTDRVEIDPYDAISSIQGVPDFNLMFLRLPLLACVSLIGDRLALHRHFDKAPILEFARHLRNAASHGNRWNLTNGQPSRPASLRSRSIDASMHGSQPVLFDWLSPGDVLDLFDDVAAHLRSL